MGALRASTQSNISLASLPSRREATNPDWCKFQRIHSSQFLCCPCSLVQFSIILRFVLLFTIMKIYERGLAAGRSDKPLSGSGHQHVYRPLGVSSKTFVIVFCMCHSVSHYILMLLCIYMIIATLNFSLIYNGFSLEGTKALADVLKTNPFLLTLNFQFNDIGDSGCAILAEALRFNSSLISLNLSNNHIGSKGARALADMLRFNVTLETLSLQYNALHDLGARLLAEALAVNSTLQELAVGGNDIGPEGTHDIAEALTLNQTLLFLDFQSNQPDDSGVRRLAAALQESNISLLGLDLHACGVSDAGAGALAEMLSHNQILTGLNLDNNKIADCGMAALSESLRKKVSVLSHLDLSSASL